MNQPVCFEFQFSGEEFRSILGYGLKGHKSLLTYSKRSMRAIIALLFLSFFLLTVWPQVWPPGKNTALGGAEFGLVAAIYAAVCILLTFLAGLLFEEKYKKAHIKTMTEKYQGGKLQPFSLPRRFRVEGDAATSSYAGEGVQCTYTFPLSCVGKITQYGGCLHIELENENTVTLPLRVIEEQMTVEAFRAMLTAYSNTNRI